MERRTWLPEAPEVQSQRQNTDREIHCHHAPLGPISIYIYLPPNLPPPLYLFLVLHPWSFPSHHSISPSLFLQTFISLNACFPLGQCSPSVNPTLFYPSLILLSCILPRLTAQLTSFPASSLSLNAC